MEKETRFMWRILKKNWKAVRVGEIVQTEKSSVYHVVVKSNSLEKLEVVATLSDSTSSYLASQTSR